MSGNPRVRDSLHREATSDAKGRKPSESIAGGSVVVPPFHGDDDDPVQEMWRQSRRSAVLAVLGSALLGMGLSLMAAFWSDPPGTNLATLWWRIPRAAPDWDWAAIAIALLTIPTALAIPVALGPSSRQEGAQLLPVHEVVRAEALSYLAWGLSLGAGSILWLLAA